MTSDTFNRLAGDCLGPSSLPLLPHWLLKAPAPRTYRDYTLFPGAWGCGAGGGRSAVHCPLVVALLWEQNQLKEELLSPKIPAFQFLPFPSIAA